VFCLLGTPLLHAQHEALFDDLSSFGAFGGPVLEFSSVNGQLTADAPSANDPGNPNPGLDGDRLPGTSDFNFASSAQYTCPIADYEGFARVDYSYTGGSTTTFNERSINGNGESSFFEIDGYHLLNLQAGLNFGNVTASAYAENLTNTRANLLTDNASAIVRITRNRPRTVGVRFTYNH